MQVGCPLTLGERAAGTGVLRPATADDYAASVASAVAMESGVGALDKAAVDINGRPLPVKPATDKAGQPKVSAPKNDNKES